MQNAPSKGALAKALEDRRDCFKPDIPLPLTPEQELLLTRYRAARARIDAASDLLDAAIDLHALLFWGVLGLDDAKAEVAELRRAVETHKRRGQNA